MKKGDSYVSGSTYIVQCYDSSTSDQFETPFVIVVVVDFVAIDQCEIEGATFAFGNELVCKVLKWIILDNVRRSCWVDSMKGCLFGKDNPD